MPLCPDNPTGPSVRAILIDLGKFMKRFVVTCVVLIASICAAETQTWEIDPNHTTSQFSVRHLGISTVRGVFEKTAGTVVYDPSNPSKTQIDATLEVSSVNTRIARRDNDLRSPNFFDVAKYPTITFKSKKAEIAGQGKLRITGDLTIHGVTKEVMLDVDGPSQPVNAMGGVRMGAEGTTKINRRDFGVNGAATVAGDEVQIILDVELKRTVAK
jgi:polyisoprenoid-binding protein YceI